MGVCVCGLTVHVHVAHLVAVICRGAGEWAGGLTTGQQYLRGATIAPTILLPPYDSRHPAPALQLPPYGYGFYPTGTAPAQPHLPVIQT